MHLRRRFPAPMAAARGAALLIALTGGIVGTACGSDAGAAPARETTLVVEAFENGDAYDYRAVGGVDVRAGDRLTIEMRNVGALIHDLALIHPDGSTIATAPPIVGGDTVALTVDLEDPGLYRLNCNVDNHLTQHGMQQWFEVLNADGTSAE